MKTKLINSFLFIIMGLGILCMSYPSIADLWNSTHQSHAINTYTKDVSSMDKTEINEIYNKAVNYNNNLYNKKHGRFNLSEQDYANYKSQLTINNSEIMGYIKIPGFNLNLPIRHGVDESTLAAGAGHMPGSSLPIGGENTHSVISAHTGLPSQKMFTNLDKIKSGDIFIIKYLDRTITYKVDQIKVVLPNNTDYIQIEDGKDYCTLITCTPYGVNSHRLLVRGKRIANIEPEPNVSNIDPVSVVVLLISIYFLYLFIKRIKRKSKEVKHKDN